MQGQVFGKTVTNKNISEIKDVQFVEFLLMCSSESISFLTFTYNSCESRCFIIRIFKRVTFRSIRLLLVKIVGQICSFSNTRLRQCACSQFHIVISCVIRDYSQMQTGVTDHHIIKDFLQDSHEYLIAPSNTLLIYAFADYSSFSVSS